MHSKDIMMAIPFSERQTGKKHTATQSLNAIKGSLHCLNTYINLHPSSATFHTTR
jgi:hypothetical protein